MNKYALVYDVVNRLTDAPMLRAFFIAHLMARSNRERQKISQRFWKDAETLEEAEQQTLKDAFNRSFIQLLPLVNQLHDKVVAAQANEAARA